MPQKEEFYSVLKRVLARRKAEVTAPTATYTQQISLEEQLSVMARIKAKREAQLSAPVEAMINRRTHRDMLQAYSAN